MFQILLGLKTCVHLAMNFSLTEGATMQWSVAATSTLVGKKIKRDEVC
jgi:hypothetical protein